MLLFFLIGTAVFRGSLNYLLFNALISIGFVVGILMSNSLLFIIGCYGKVGYYKILIKYLS